MIDNPLNKKQTFADVSPQVQSHARYLEIGADDEGQRIDNFLMRVLKGLPRSRVYRSLRKGEVRVNRGRIRPDYRLQRGDRVRVPPVRLSSREPSQPSPKQVEAITHRVIFEDEVLLVIDKPSGIAVHGGSGVSVGVIEALRQARGSGQHLELVHRLDRDTSGVLVIAKRRSALRSLHAMLRDGEVEKRYLALVAGDWQLGRQTVTEPLKTHHRRGGERWVVVHPEGKSAVTYFRPAESYKSATLMEVLLGTGRTHQIRVHAAHCGHPLAGDQKYGDRPFNKAMKILGLGRLFLHANAIGFTHPRTGEPFHVSAPLSDDLRRVLDRLEEGRR